MEYYTVNVKVIIEADLFMSDAMHVAHSHECDYKLRTHWNQAAVRSQEGGEM